jgi:hypothetical protein
MDALNFEAALGNDTAAIWVAGWLADGRAVDSRIEDGTWCQQPWTPRPDPAALRAQLAVTQHRIALLTGGAR